MALGHNVLIRGLNSIYLQAPNISAEDAADFISYAKCWHEILHAHHTMEETVLFPAIEAKTGEKGIMDGNVEQHRSPPFLCLLFSFSNSCHTLELSYHPAPSKT